MLNKAQELGSSGSGCGLTRPQSVRAPASSQKNRYAVEVLPMLPRLLLLLRHHLATPLLTWRAAINRLHAHSYVLALVAHWPQVLPCSTRPPARPLARQDLAIPTISSACLHVYETLHSKNHSFGSFSTLHLGRVLECSALERASAHASSSASSCATRSQPAPRRECVALRPSHAACSAHASL